MTKVLVICFVGISLLSLTCSEAIRTRNGSSEFWGIGACELEVYLAYGRPG
jgi:hypothetical protein